MKLASEIINYILSYRRPTHDNAKMIKKEIKKYNCDMVEYPSHSRTVIHGRTGKPYQKQYYNIKPCVEHISFSQYCLNSHDYEIYPDYSNRENDFTN